MDYVDDARAILRKMEKNGIGLKRAVFYSAYALYYEKKKKFEDAERMYHLGAQNLAEPAGDLRKSYEQFLHRMMVVQKRKANQATSKGGNSTSKRIPSHPGKTKAGQNYKINQGESSQVSHCNTKCENQRLHIEHTNSSEGCSVFAEGGSNGSTKHIETTKRSDSFPNLNEVSSCSARLLDHQGSTDMDLVRPSPSSTDDTVVVKFVGSAIVGKSEAEDACHHGLVDPTINMKEAMNAISCMFREPLESDPIVRRSHRSKPKANQQSSKFEIYVDDNTEGPSSRYQKSETDNKLQKVTQFQKPFVGGFKILADDDDSEDECGDGYSAESNIQSKPTGLVFSRPTEQTSKRCNEPNNTITGLREDTVVHRFVGSTVQGVPEVENACHHGLVDPTINLKEAMDDINSMFGKPLDYAKVRKQSKRSNSFAHEPSNLGFSILADDDIENDAKGKALSRVPCSLDDGHLFEPTIFTKEAMADINEMFGKPLDF